MDIFAGDYIRIDDEGRVALILHADHSDPSEPGTPADIRPHDEIDLGFASKLRTLRDFCLSDAASAELDLALEAWESVEDDGDPSAGLRRDYERSTSPCYA